MSKICEFKNCEEKAFYARFYEKPERCKAHKENRKLRYRICMCGKTEPHYNYEGEKEMYCKQCKLANMVDVRHKKCKCGKGRPNYNYEGEKAMYCANCKLPGMVDVVSRKCPCGKFPNYNYEGEKAMYCADCKKPGMVNVTHKKCQCGKSRARYNYEGEKALYCFDCKLPGMINVVDSKCSCGNIPTFNYEGEKAMYCSKCKTPGMVDVKHKKCPCGKVPNFNYEGETVGICCFDCKKPGMIDVTHKRCLCGKGRASYNYEGEKTPVCCVLCKKENMIDVVNKRCLGQKGLCPMLGNPKYRYYCTFCFSQTFPDDPLTSEIRVKTKELVVRNYIDENFKGFTHDRQLYTGDCDCTHRRRIDHRILIGNTMLAIETDEFQHRNYDNDDEEIRHDDLYMIYSGKWIYIRFNPDPYTDEKGKKRNPDIKSRLKKLKKVIENQIDVINNEQNEELVEIIKLYYDH